MRMSTTQNASAWTVSVQGSDADSPLQSQKPCVLTYLNRALFCLRKQLTGYILHYRNIDAEDDQSPPNTMNHYNWTLTSRCRQYLFERKRFEAGLSAICLHFSSIVVVLVMSLGIANTSYASQDPIVSPAHRQILSQQHEKNLDAARTHVLKTAKAHRSLVEEGASIMRQMDVASHAVTMPERLLEGISSALKKPMSPLREAVMKVVAQHQGSLLFNKGAERATTRFESVEAANREWVSYMSDKDLCVGGVCIVLRNPHLRTEQDTDLLISSSEAVIDFLAMKFDVLDHKALDVLYERLSLIGSASVEEFGKDGHSIIDFTVTDGSESGEILGNVNYRFRFGTNGKIEFATVVDGQQDSWAMSEEISDDLLYRATVELHEIMNEDPSLQDPMNAGNTPLVLLNRAIEDVDLYSVDDSGAASFDATRSVGNILPHDVDLDKIAPLLGEKVKDHPAWAGLEFATDVERAVLEKASWFGGVEDADDLTLRDLVKENVGDLGFLKNVGRRRLVGCLLPFIFKALKLPEFDPSFLYHPLSDPDAAERIDAETLKQPFPELKSSDSLSTIFSKLRKAKIMTHGDAIRKLYIDPLNNSPEAQKIRKRLVFEQDGEWVAIPRFTRKQRARLREYLAEWIEENSTPSSEKSDN